MTAVTSWSFRLPFDSECSLFVLMDEDGQIHTLSLLERLRTECRELWGSSSALYQRVDDLLRELANPNFQDIPMRLPFRVELWNRNQQHIRWVIAATSSIAVGRAAFDVAISTHIREHLTLRNGAQLIRQHMPKDGGEHAPC